MEAKQKVATTNRRPKMEPTTVFLLDQARARVAASKKPSLAELCEKLGGWNVPEVSGRLKK
jgi:hypothetical protein